MAPRRILVTGAGGFVGSHLLPALRRAYPGAVLIGGSRHAVEGTVRGVDEAIHLDLDDGAALPAVISQARPDAVVHLAAQADVGASFRNPLAVWRTNLLGTLALGEAVLSVAPEACFITASSGEIYGLAFQSGASLREDAGMLPANPYAASKAAADLAIGEMALRGLRSIRMRCFTHTGAGQAEGFVVAAFARQIARIEAGLQPPVLKVGALNRWRDFLDVQDVCAAYVAAINMANELPAGIALNICSGTSRNIGDMLQVLLGFTEVKIEVIQEVTRMRSTDVERVQGNSDLARRLLGWEPAVAWEVTLENVLTDWRGRVIKGQ